MHKHINNNKKHLSRALYTQPKHSVLLGVGNILMALRDIKKLPFICLEITESK